MIKSNELRHGNIVFGEHRSSAESKPHLRECTILSVAQYGSDCSYAFADTEQMPKCSDGIDGLAFARYEFMQPIPLTPEILEKCGFEEQKYSKGTWSCDEFSILIRDFQPVTMGRDDYELFGKPLKSLHQLQNLFFALTGEELTVKETG